MANKCEEASSPSSKKGRKNNNSSQHATSSDEEGDEEGDEDSSQRDASEQEGYRYEINGGLSEEEALRQAEQESLGMTGAKPRGSKNFTGNLSEEEAIRRALEASLLEERGDHPDNHPTLTEEQQLALAIAESLRTGAQPTPPAPTEAQKEQARNYVRPGLVRAYKNFRTLIEHPESEEDRKMGRERFEGQRRIVYLDAAERVIDGLQTRPADPQQAMREVNETFVSLDGLGLEDIAALVHAEDPPRPPPPPAPAVPPATEPPTPPPPKLPQTSPAPKTLRKAHKLASPETQGAEDIEVLRERAYQHMRNGRTLTPNDEEKLRNRLKDKNRAYLNNIIRGR